LPISQRASSSPVGDSSSSGWRAATWSQIRRRISLRDRLHSAARSSRLTTSRIATALDDRQLPSLRFATR
jgi:hypothetical protein